MCVNVIVFLIFCSVSVLPCKTHTVHGTSRTRSVELWALHVGMMKNTFIRALQQGSIQLVLQVSSTMLSVFNAIHFIILCPKVLLLQIKICIMADDWHHKIYECKKIHNHWLYHLIADKLIGKDAGSVGGLSSTYPKTFNQDTGHVSKDVLGGEVINIMQDQEEHSGEGCCM